jgi:hypothetical protein
MAFFRGVEPWWVKERDSTLKSGTVSKVKSAKMFQMVDTCRAFDDRHMSTYWMMRVAMKFIA